jgi:hypothetical protein
MERGLLAYPWLRKIFEKLVGEQVTHSNYIARMRTDGEFNSDFEIVCVTIMLRARFHVALLDDETLPLKCYCPLTNLMQLQPEIYQALPLDVRALCIDAKAQDFFVRWVIFLPRIPRAWCVSHVFQNMDCR